MQAISQAELGVVAPGRDGEGGRAWSAVREEAPGEAHNARVAFAPLTSRYTSHDIDMRVHCGQSIRQTYHKIQM